MRAGKAPMISKDRHLLYKRPGGTSGCRLSTDVCLSCPSKHSKAKLIRGMLSALFESTCDAAIRTDAISLIHNRKQTKIVKTRK